LPANLLVESFDLSEVKVDHENHVIHGVKVTGKVSNNNREYTDKAIEKSSRVFENVPVTVRGGHDRKHRDYHCQNGQLRNGRAEKLGSKEACSRYDWFLNEADPLTKKILVDAEKFPQNIPLSHEVGRWKESKKGGVTLIEDITDDPKFLGVAAVYRGGTNSSLFESHEEIMEIKTKEELKATFPVLCEQLEEAACACATQQRDEKAEKVENLIAEKADLKKALDDLQAELNQYKQAEQDHARREKITESAKEICGDGFLVEEDLMEDLLELYDDDRYLRILKRMAPESAEGDPAGAPKSKSGTSYSANGKKPRKKLSRREL
jgi:hypothetical protein